VRVYDLVQKKPGRMVGEWLIHHGYEKTKAGKRLRLRPCKPCR
jgi:hypothetical protein